MSEWVTIECERVLYVSDGNTKILCDRLPSPVTIVIKPIGKNKMTRTNFSKNEDEFRQSKTAILQYIDRSIGPNELTGKQALRMLEEIRNDLAYRMEEVREEINKERRKRNAENN